MSTADSQTSNPSPLVFKVAFNPSGAEVLDQWKLAKDDILWIDPDKLVEVGHGYALVKVVGKVTAAQRSCINPSPDPERDNKTAVPTYDPNRKGRILSQDESAWIEHEQVRIEETALCLYDLADMVITAGEIADCDKTDPHFKVELGTKGCVKLGFAIQRLAEKLLSHQEEIERVLNGTALAMQAARVEAISRRYAEAAERRTATPAG